MNTMSPRHRQNPGMDNYEDEFDNYDTQTKDGYQPSDMMDFHDDMDEHFQKGGQYRADHFNKHRTDKNNHTMTGFFKFLGCCAER